jgi:hypothetical protein
VLSDWLLIQNRGRNVDHLCFLKAVVGTLEPALFGAVTAASQFGRPCLKSGATCRAFQQDARPASNLLAARCTELLIWLVMDVLSAALFAFAGTLPDAIQVTHVGAVRHVTARNRRDEDRPATIAETRLWWFE